MKVLLILAFVATSLAFPERDLDSFTPGRPSNQPHANGQAQLFGQGVPAEAPAPPKETKPLERPQRDVPEKQTKPLPRPQNPLKQTKPFLRPQRPQILPAPGPQIPQVLPAPAPQRPQILPPPGPQVQPAPQKETKPLARPQVEEE